MHGRTHAFTLVELLVVITIIVILIAMLTPALDRAIYQAQLAVCGARLRGIGAAVTVYAMDQKRLYPRRPIAEAALCVVDIVRYRGRPAELIDDRDLFKALTGLAPLLDPMVDAVDLDTAKSDFVRTTYGLWFDMRIPGEKPMRRVGDRFTWTSRDVDEAAPSTRRFDVLAGDMDAYFSDLDRVASSHPDADGLLSPERFQDDVIRVPTGVGTIDSASGSVTTTYSWWSSAAGVSRGPADYSYAHADGSVDRLTDVAPGTPTTTDERVRQAPLFTNGANGAERYLRLPTR